MADSTLHELVRTNNAEAMKLVEQAVITQSVIDLPSVEEGYRPSSQIVFNIANQADEFLPWGYDLKTRDKQLRSFWPTEPLLSSAVYMMSARMAAMTIEIAGRDPEAPRPKNTIAAAERMLMQSDRGKGWQQLMVKLMTDVYTQDNGGFIEIIRQANRPDAPVLGIAHLDSYRCTRTGDPKVPVLYMDRKGRLHKMNWWNIQTVEDMPSPIEEMYGAQYCAVTRALRAAQIIRDIAIYKKEKVSGQARAVHFIAGVTRTNIEDGLRIAEENRLNQNLARYTPVPIIPTLDPESRLAHVQVDLASLPDGFDEQITFQWYVTQLAAAFGVDYQEFAPLASGALGSGQQSEILHLKARGKGPAMMITSLENVFNNNGLLPRNVKLSFKTEDASGDAKRAQAQFFRGKDRSLRIASGELDAEAARVLAVRDGDMPVELMEDMQNRVVQPPPAPISPLTSQQTMGGLNSNNAQ